MSRKLKRNLGFMENLEFSGAENCGLASACTCFAQSTDFQALLLSTPIKEKNK
jgi:hypothetical protein